MAAPGILIVGFTTRKFYRHNGTAWDCRHGRPRSGNRPATGITVDSTNGDVLIVGTTTDKFYRHNGSVWDAGTDVPAGGKLQPARDNG